MTADMTNEPLVADSEAAGKCPVIHGETPSRAGGSAAKNWWPDRLNLKILSKETQEINPQGDFDYRKNFENVDLDELRKDVEEVMTTSMDWWPADFGHYGPAMIRMAWHSAGTYRVTDGRGGSSTGQQRFAPLNSWPDNAGLDKPRRLLWPVKKKWGRQVSWADLMIFAGTVAMENMGFKSYGFAGGRVDAWEPDDDIYWGAEQEWLTDSARYVQGETRDLESPLAATEMGLIYVNPEGIGGNPDPVELAADIRATFGRMAMNDEETVALIAGGHTFGKTHGAGDPDLVGGSPEEAPMEQMGMGWKNAHGTGMGDDQTASGLEVTWTYHPTRWDNEFFHILFAYEWELMESPAGAKQWRPKDGAGADMVPMAHDASSRREPRMLTSDLSLRFDPAYGEISRRFKDNPEEFADAFARAWFKLTHRDLGPRSRYLGKLSPTEDLVWQDPVPAVDHELITAADEAALKAQILESGLSVSELVATAWASAASFRASDRRGGANGARIALAPQKDWESNNPARTAKVLEVLRGIKAGFDTDAKKVSLADLIVLGGNAAVEQAASAAGVPAQVAFNAGRTDATQAQTDVESFNWLEPIADGFRNYVSGAVAAVPAEHLLVDKAQLLSLTTPEMTALVGGLRVLDTNWDGSAHGVLTERPGVLSNDFFVNVLDMGTTWEALDSGSHAFVGKDFATGDRKWTATRADLVFGSNSELRAVAEVYGADDAQVPFVEAFVAAWGKVMELDRFDIEFAGK